MADKAALVITSISAPNEVLKAFASGCRENDIQFILIGDEPSPSNFQLDGCRFYSLSDQNQLEFKFARLCPTRHYARKNIGYLLALRDGASVIIETDDDNFPEATFWSTRHRRQSVATANNLGWVNVYRYFTEANIWPRGLPLDHINSALPEFASLPHTELDCPIQQGLADQNPDVDAIYRLTLPLPQSFRRDRRIALAADTWSPFNSQNTTWWRAASSLLYLPGYCSFRMTDIWRSFIAQRIAWANNWAVLFHEPTVWQERNEHSLMRDFRDEVPGYLNNSKICEILGQLAIKPGEEYLGDNLRLCYETLVSMDLVGKQELALVDAWLQDLRIMQQ